MGLNPWLSGDWWVSNQLSHGKYNIWGLLSFAHVQKWPTRRSSPIVTFWVLKRRTRRHGDTLRVAFAINRGIAITGLNMNSRVCGIYFTKQWGAETLQPGLEFDKFKPWPESGIYKCISWLNGWLFSMQWSTFSERGTQDLANVTNVAYQFANVFLSSAHL